jgi:tetratricopeptide (TPR) repeat protein
MIIDPQSQRRLLAASGYAELSLFQEAVEELEELPEPVKKQPLVLTVWLDVYQRWEKWSEAEFVAARLFDLQPEEPSWAVALAYATRRTRGLTVAKQILEQAGEKFPDCATIQFNLACYAAQLGRTDEALDYVRRAIELDKNFASIAQSDSDLEPIRGQIGQ